MLQNLHVKNLALIDECEVEFSEGLNILSGETGAGKSIIIGSISLALGEKVPKEMLRNNGEPAFVELIFSVDNPQTAASLKELDIEFDDEQTIILSRKITKNRVIGRINGEAVSASKMKAAAAFLIDIHGQHEHQSLLNKRNHLTILDEYAKSRISGRKADLAILYREYRNLQEDYEKSGLDEEQRKRELSFLEYEVQEIRSAALTPGEDEELEREYRRLANGRKIMEGAAAAYAATGDDEENASERIGRAVRELGAVSGYDPELAGLEEQLTEIDSLLSDFNHELSAYISGADFDEETLYETEKRLDEINHLKSKYGKTIKEILQALEEKEARISILNDYENYRNQLKKRMKEEEKKVCRLCTEISEIRHAAAEKLIPAITAALKDLNFLDVRFQMQFKKLDGYTANGFDDAEFLISTNPGEPLRPLERVASGGELSRIMLAIKTVMAETDYIGTLIFDEIDTGISGRTAQMVSEKMNTLGRTHQIICITHLPQIAAMADSHYLIRKAVEQESTRTHIRRLKEEESVTELARMLGGVEITDTVLQNAREMKALAATKKKY